MKHSLRNWESLLRGKAKNAFGKATSPQSEFIPKRQKDRDSEMVRNSAPRLDEGPKPPGFVYHAVKKRQFNEDWRKEYRQARRHQPKLAEQVEPSPPRRSYEEFMRVAGPEKGMSR